MNKKYRTLMLATTLSICGAAIALIALSVYESRAIANVKANQLDRFQAFEKKLREAPEPPCQECIEHAKFEYVLRQEHLNSEERHYDIASLAGAFIATAGLIQIAILFDRRNRPDTRTPAAQA